MRGTVQREHIREEHAARLRALQHFDKREKEDVRVSFNAIKADACPVFYDDNLNRLEGRLCAGTGKWLLADTTFRKWLDPSNVSMRRLWLRGIPGAGQSKYLGVIYCMLLLTLLLGKTFLVATAIRHVMKYGCTIFAYLSHTLSSKTSALSIIVSLIFQLAQADYDLQVNLCQLNRENLKNDLSVGEDLLKNLLQCAGPVYIVIDGVDEVDKIERERLLEKLLAVSNACQNVMILIASRSEDDIATILERTDPSEPQNPVFGSIRIDNRNSGSIQTFINHRAKEWFAERQFLGELKSGIEALLAPLAAKAKGV